MRKDPILASSYPQEPAFGMPLPDTSLLPDSLVAPDGLDTSIVLELAGAALHADRIEAEESLLRCIERGVPVDALIDKYIPHVARLLGEYWCVDSLGFAEVTIAVARLQGHIRMLDQMAPRPPLSDLDPPAILLVIPPQMYHTLGPMIALSKFRRLGASVRLVIAQSSEDLAKPLEDAKFDMVALSASGCEKLELLRLLVDKVRRGGPEAPPIVIGGSILDTDPEAHIHIGADYSAADPEEALTLCGLMIPTSGASLCANEV